MILHNVTTFCVSVYEIATSADLFDSVINMQSYSITSGANPYDLVVTIKNVWQCLEHWIGLHYQNTVATDCLFVYMTLVLH